MEALIALVGLYFLYLPLLGAVVALVQILRLPKPRSRGAVFEICLRQYMLFAIGLCYLFNFVYHTVFADFSARQIGWANSPFQIEVGTASLGFALVGFLAVRGNDMVRLAALLATAPFMWGAAVTHIVDIVQTQNFAPGNAGFVLYLDILIPAIGFFLWWGARHFRAAAPADALNTSSPVV
jgi:hypothetical protein